MLYELFLPYTDEKAISFLNENKLSKTDLYIDGLLGAHNSAEKRDALAKKLGLPSKMTANALLAALRMLYTYEEYLELIGRGKEA